MYAKPKLVEGYGQMMKTARKNAGISQEALAEMMDVDIKSIKLWENERFQPKRSNIAKLERTLGIKLMEV